MDDRKPSAMGAPRLIVAALLAAGFALAAVAYVYSDDLIDLLRSAMGGKLHTQSHIRY